MNWQELQHKSLEEILSWAETQPWCKAMMDCFQDPEWHAEGDVWTHTKLVCQQLLKLDEWDSLSPRDKTLLTFTAIFHDSGKPSTSRVDHVTGRITSPHHARRSEQIVRTALRDLECDFMTREDICRHVRYHGRPVFLLERASPENEVVRMSCLVQNYLLYLFALADNRGRGVSRHALSRPEENLHYWKLLSEELECYYLPYQFQNDLARFEFFRSDESSLHYHPYEDFRCSVTMMSGLPGSGKDTYLTKYLRDLPIISLDNIRKEFDVDPTDDQGGVIQIARARCRKYLGSKTSFVLNATNLIKQTRQNWINLFTDYKARVHITYVEPPFKTILEQNKRREKPVPETVIRELADKYEPPNWTEAHSFSGVTDFWVTPK